MPTAAPRPLRVRQKIGKYRIERRLGEGGFANVFQAMDTVMGIRVAIKVPHGSLVDDELLSSFRREARLVARLNHPGVLQIRDASVIDERLVIAFPLGKETLSDRLTRRMSFETTLSFTEQLLSATAHAHERKVIHCDIKPENVILFDGGDAKLADFGIAKMACRTLRGCGTGTVGYMAPEQAMGRPSSRSDVFSLGLLVWRMLSGEWPEWPYQWPLDGYQRMHRRISPSMIQWLRKAIELSPNDRFRDAESMRQAYLKIRPAAIRYMQLQRARKRRGKQDTQTPRQTLRAA